MQLPRHPALTYLAAGAIVAVGATALRALTGTPITPLSMVRPIVIGLVCAIIAWTATRTIRGVQRHGLAPFRVIFFTWGIAAALLAFIALLAPPLLRTWGGLTASATIWITALCWPSADPEDPNDPDELRAP